MRMELDHAFNTAYDASRPECVFREHAEQVFRFTAASRVRTNFPAAAGDLKVESLQDATWKREIPARGTETRRYSVTARPAAGCPAYGSAPDDVKIGRLHACAGTKPLVAKTAVVLIPAEATMQLLVPAQFGFGPIWTCPARASELSLAFWRVLPETYTRSRAADFKDVRRRVVTFGVHAEACAAARFGVKWLKPGSPGCSPAPCEPDHACDVTRGSIVYDWKATLVRVS